MQNRFCVVTFENSISGDCKPPDSLVNYYFPSTRVDAAGSAEWVFDGGGDLASVSQVTQNLIASDTTLFFDRGFSASNPESTRVIRFVVQL
jgi:hypothetical protein